MRRQFLIAIPYLLPLLVTGCTTKSTNSITTLNPQAVAGVYLGVLPAADTAGRRVIVDLRPDSTATLTMEFPGKGMVTQRGRWSSLPPQIRFDFEPVSGRRPESITWKIDGEELVPLIWDRNEYGQAGLPLHRKR